MTDAPAGSRFRFRVRLGDFAIEGRRVTLIKTGNSATINAAVAIEVAVWLSCFLLVKLAALRHLGRPRPAIWFTPDVPHPRYMVRIAAIWAGLPVARSPGRAAAAFFFDDATTSDAPPAAVDRAFNFACSNITKSRVATVFADVFGYDLAIDPTTWKGPAVEKSEANGTHDGRIVICPCDPAHGRVYQRVIDNVADGISTDLRTHVVSGRVVAVWIKRRDAARRFQPANRSAKLVSVDTVYTPDELEVIARFATAMGADWAGLDVLRDVPSGRLYVVDVNKTDAGPIIALSLADKLRSVALLGRALTDLVQPVAASSATASASTRARIAA